MTIDGYPEVSEDGRTLRDDDPQTVIRVRDAAGNAVADLRGTGGPPVTGVRMGVGVGVPDLPIGTPSAGTPTA